MRCDMPRRTSRALSRRKRLYRRLGLLEPAARVRDPVARIIDQPKHAADNDICSVREFAPSQLAALRALLNISNVLPEQHALPTKSFPSTSRHRRMIV